MLKKRIAVLGIILFAASLFPWNAPATDTVQNSAPEKNCIKVIDQSKADQVNPTADKKPVKRKG